MPHREMIQERSRKAHRSSDSTFVDVEDFQKTAMPTPCDSPVPNLIPDDLSSSSDCESEEEEEAVTRKVTFKSSLKMRKIASHRKYTKDERASTWYSRAEYIRLRDTASRTAKKIARGANVDEDGRDSSRGLEYRSFESHKIRQTKRLDIIWTVLVEQDEYYENDEEVDHDKIAEIYSLRAKDCVAEARKRGLEDEAAVRVLHQAPTAPSSSHPVFTNRTKTDDIMNLVAALSMKAAMSVQR